MSVCARREEIIRLSTEPESSSLSWRSRPQDRIVWAFFDNDFVAFHRPSGKTHFLNAASYLLLNDVLGEARDLPYILGVFDSDETPRDDEAYASEMLSLLHRLETLGLIERV